MDKKKKNRQKKKENKNKKNQRKLHPEAARDFILRSLPIRIVFLRLVPHPAHSLTPPYSCEFNASPS
jgi:hypothetical protein